MDGKREMGGEEGWGGEGKGVGRRERGKEEKRREGEGKDRGKGREERKGEGRDSEGEGRGHGRQEGKACTQKIKHSGPRSRLTFLLFAETEGRCGSGDVAQGLKFLPFKPDSACLITGATTF